MEINGYQVEKSHTSLVEDRIYTGSSYLKKVLENHEYYVPVWSYMFLREIFLQGSFSFRKGIYHEDEQLTPYLLLYANSIVAFKEKGYHYFVRDNSIATNKCGKKNVQDLFAIFKENAHFFETKVSDVPLKKLLLNDIVEKMIYVLCRYRVRKQEQRRYIDKHFLFKHALGVKNKARVLIFVYFF